MKQKLIKYLIGLSLLILCLVWLSVFKSGDQNLHLITCNVGQGDAILTTYKNMQILTDGGTPQNRVMACLEKYMPLGDKEIELVVLTHPQLDHYGGLIRVFQSYKVDNLLANAVDSSSQEYGLLKKIVGSSRTKVVNPRQGMKITSGLIHLDILNPTNKLLTQEYDEHTGLPQGNLLGKFETKRDLNDFSIVDIISFGKFNALLTGDIGPAQIAQIIEENKIPTVKYIKVPHHGSKNGLTQELLNVVDPKIAVISVGKNNIYRHPSPEIVSMLKQKAIATYRTDENGNIELVTDGTKYWLEKN